MTIVGVILLAVVISATMLVTAPRVRSGTLSPVLVAVLLAAETAAVPWIGLIGGFTSDVQSTVVQSAILGTGTFVVIVLVTRPYQNRSR